jgi:hypothetical protein
MEKRARLLRTLALLVLVSGLPPEAAIAKKKGNQTQTGVIAGTVFQQSGFVLRGAGVMVKPMVADGVKIDKKQIHSVKTDGRGEFAVRVPGGGLRYTVSVESEGWQSQQKDVEVPWDQRVDVNFRLKPAPGGESTK